MKLSFRQIDVPPLREEEPRYSMRLWAIDALAGVICAASWLVYWFLTPGSPL